MAKWNLVLDADSLNRTLDAAFPGAQRSSDMVREVSPGRVHLVGRYNPLMLRPGGFISGPNLMSMADSVGYVLVMAHAGPELMALTSSLTINFLRGAVPGDIHAEGELLSMGRRLAVCDVRLWTESPDRLAAQATVTYARAAVPAA
jgi:uncharacterized protein (TIGR00369 family)